jgi:tetratricopeptide (TPR) repeat protein
MAQPASNPKVEELRLRLKADPKSRLFFPLAEELRKVQQLPEAEQVLRQGLTVHPTYLSAWVSLGRICREQGKNDAAVESLSKALVLDPGNVVAARLLADSYLALGEKIEAIKKYKLVHALLPSDQDLEAVIRKLDDEINPAPAAPPEPEPEPEADLRPMPTMETPFGDAFASAPDSAPFEQSDDDRVFADAATSVADEQRMEVATGDDEPMRVAHLESPFEEPAAEAGYSSDAFGIEQPAGMHIDSAPAAAEVAEPLGDPFGDETETQAEDFYAPSTEGTRAATTEEPYVETGIASDLPFALESTLEPALAEDFAKTITMADLYAGQGLVAEARDIYEDILARDPGNESVRAKLEALSSIVPETASPEEPDYGYDDEPFAAEAPAAASAPEPFATEASVAAHDQPPFADDSSVRAEDDGGGQAPSPVPLADETWTGEAPVLDEAETAPAGEASVLNAGSGNREKIARLEQWLAKVGRREVGHVQ